MNNAEDRLRKELKQLVVLMKKIQERNASMDFLSEQDRIMLKHLDLFIKNFDHAEMKLPPEFTGDMTDSFIDMIHQLTEALREELGEEGICLEENEDLFFDLNDDSDRDLPVPTSEELLEHTNPSVPMKHRIMMAIREIDERLKEEYLDSNTADDLLDRRIELLDQLKQYS